MTSASHKPKMKSMDIRLGVTFLISLLACMAINHLIPASEHYLNLYVMGLCAVFVIQATTKATIKSGLQRVLVTYIGVAFGCLVVFLGSLVPGDIPFYTLAAIFLVATVVTVRLVGQPDIEGRIACAGFILTCFVYHGARFAEEGLTGYDYALVWICSTAFTVVITIIVAFIWQRVSALIHNKDSSNQERN